MLKKNIIRETFMTFFMKKYYLMLKERQDEGIPTLSQGTFQRTAKVMPSYCTVLYDTTLNYTLQ